MKKQFINRVTLFASMVLIAGTSCKKEKSSVTGWSYNDEKNGGFCGIRRTERCRCCHQRIVKRLWFCVGDALQIRNTVRRLRVQKRAMKKPQSKKDIF